MREELVSIIVPVFNVEDFVTDSLESIVNQSYKNLEIICINDGSTDSSSDKLQEVARQDKRVKIINQQNKGLSGARNTGLDNCSGEYIVFVDSDDIIHPNFVQILIKEIRVAKVKLAICAFEKVAALNIDFPFSFNEDLEIIECDTALKRMLRGEWWSACMKVYHRSIFTTLRFPEGRNNEDYAIMVQIIEQCPKVVYTHAELYYYLTRTNSITTSVLNIRTFDEVQNGIEVLDYVKEHHPKLYKEAEYNLGASLIKVIVKLYLDKSTSFNYKIPHLQSLVKKHFFSLIVNNVMPFKQKIFLTNINFLSVSFNRTVFRIYTKIKR